jgi:hypothetical protein
MRLTLKTLFVNLVLSCLAFGQANTPTSEKADGGLRFVKDGNGRFVLLKPDENQVITEPYSLIMSDPAAVFAMKQGAICVGCTAPTAKMSFIYSDKDTARDLIDIHSGWGIGMSIYTHADPGFRAPQITFYRSGGTQASPTPVLAGHVLASIVGAGYDGNMQHDIPGYAQPALIDIIASEDYDSTHNGAYYAFLAIAPGSTDLQYVLGLGTDVATFYEPVAAPKIVISNSSTPSSSSDVGTKGQIAWDSSFIYVCIDTNTWKRMAISKW